MRVAVGLASFALAFATQATACDLVDLDVRASSASSDVLGGVEAVRFDGFSFRGLALERRWSATVRTVEVLHGQPVGARFTYDFSDHRPDCGYWDLSVRRGSKAVFFFSSGEDQPGWALRPSDYRDARPPRS